LQLRLATVDLAASIRAAIETSRPLIDAAHHHLVVTLPDAPVLLQADEARLAQIFANLLNNSAKYTDPGGRISLTAERPGGEAVVTIRDNGIGIASEDLPAVFDMFMQADSRDTRAQSGLGIGLTLVRSLVTMHGGRVAADSAGPGKGSAFSVFLPVLTESH